MKSRSVYSDRTWAHMQVSFTTQHPQSALSMSQGLGFIANWKVNPSHKRQGGLSEDDDRFSKNYALVMEGWWDHGGSRRGLGVK